MTDLANFTPEVREAVEQFDCVTMHGDKWKAIRTELLRLAANSSATRRNENEDAGEIHSQTDHADAPESDGSAGERKLASRAGSGDLVRSGESPDVFTNSSAPTAIAALKPIDYDADYDRYYIPLPGGWEVQTKGGGSSFRIADTKHGGDRFLVPDSPYLHEHIERMAHQIHAACSLPGAQGEAVAHVPVHPRNGPLWSDTRPVGSEAHRTESYPWMALYARPPQPVAFDLVAHLERQREFSLHTFGPGARTAGVCDHIRKELAEIEAAPADVKEWVDVILLALDGAWRAGHEPANIAAAIAAKQTKNEGRSWPDWRTADPNKAIEHDRSADIHPPQQQAQVTEDLVERVARAIAENGFGCPWDEFDPLSAHDTDQSDLLEYARAALEAIAPSRAGSEAELSADPHDPATGEKIAQWLFRNGMRSTAYLVRSQLDMRAPQLVARPASDWTNEQCVEFMRVGLRHVRYSKDSNSGPLVGEIREGARAANALAAQRETGNPVSEQIQEVSAQPSPARATEIHTALADAAIGLLMDRGGFDGWWGTVDEETSANILISLAEMFAELCPAQTVGPTRCIDCGEFTGSRAACEACADHRIEWARAAAQTGAPQLADALRKAEAGLVNCVPAPGYDPETLHIVRAALAASQVPTKQTAAPEEPDTALLASMATCLNHGFGLLGHDDQQRMLGDMRKLYDEVSGNGYYSPANRDRYLDLLAAAPTPSPPAEEWYCPDCKPTDGAGCGACPNYPMRRATAPNTTNEEASK